ncbi:MAG TPA: ABC transporter substrate-binding protein, partial [Ktedonobacteraceae bacterium]
MFVVRQRRPFLFTAFLLLCLSLAACGGGGSTTQTPGSTPTQGPTTLSVCQINKSINFFPFFVAQQKGYFKAQGLSIANPPLLQVGSKVVDGVEGGNCDIGNGVMTDVFSWVKVDPSARVIGAFMNGFVVDVVVSKSLEQAAHVSATSPLAAKVAALKGKKIGITGPGAGTQALLTYLFKQAGMNASKDITEVSLGSNNVAALASLKAGRVDALSFFSPIGQAAEAQNIGDIFISPVRGDIPGLTGDVHGVFYTKQSVLTAKPRAIAAYIRAINQAETFIQNNSDAAKTLLNAYLGLGQSVTDAVYAAQSGGIAKNPQIPQAAYTVAGQFHVGAGLITHIPAYCSVIAT